MGDGSGGGGAQRREKPMAFGAAVPEDYVAIRSIPSVSRCSIPRARPFRRHRPPHALPAGRGLPSARPRPPPDSLSALELRPKLCS